jgi:hypothetical protein
MPTVRGNRQVGFALKELANDEAGLGFGEGDEGCGALDAGDGADARAEDRWHIDKLRHFYFGNDVVGTHDFVKLDEAFDLLESIVDALGRAGIGDDKDISFYRQGITPS